MEIQLTKTKTITIGGGGGNRRRTMDIVGIELFGGDPRGCPAVRLRERKGTLRIVAAGFVSSPNCELPTSWEEASKTCVWSLPAAFQAPHAALCVTSPDMFLSQTTVEAFKSDLTAGGHRSDGRAADGEKTPRVGLRRSVTAKAAESVPANQPPPTFNPGEPLSHGGTRFVMKPMDGGQFIMEASLPEYQTLWLSRLLPEGRRPTAKSIQLRPSALIASITRQPAFTAGRGTALALFLGDSDVTIAGYRDGDLVLYRQCRGVRGWRAVREAVRDGLGLGDDMVDGALSDNLIDPRPFIEPIVREAVDELAVCRDYFVGKLGIDLQEALLVGPAVAALAYAPIAEERARLRLKPVETFAELGAPTVEGARPEDFAAALGAALAVLADEEVKA